MGLLVGHVLRRRTLPCGTPLISLGESQKNAANALAGLSGPYRSQAIGVHRRDVDENQHDPPARLAKGQRLVDKVPHGRWKTATFLAALRNDRIDAPCLFDGPINGERFRAYVEQLLVPTLKPGDVAILDNLGSHKAKAIRRAIRDVGARLVFLPKYSPDLNPIEQVFAKFKTLLERPKPEHTTLSPTQAQPSSLNTRPKNAPPM